MIQIDDVKWSLLSIVHSCCLMHLWSKYIYFSLFWSVIILDIAFVSGQTIWSISGQYWVSFLRRNTIIVHIIIDWHWTTSTFNWSILWFLVTLSFCINSWILISYLTSSHFFSWRFSIMNFLFTRLLCSILEIVNIFCVYGLGLVGVYLWTLEE